MTIWKSGEPPSLFRKDRRFFSETDWKTHPVMPSTLKRHSTALTFLLCAGLLMTCKKNEEPNCGCFGKTGTRIYRVAAGYAGMNSFWFTEAGPHGSTGGLAILCDTTVVKPHWKPDRAKRNFIISGYIKDQCRPFDYIPIFPIYAFVPTEIEEIP